MNDLDFDIQEKLTNVMKERQIQLSELKTYYDKNNDKFYKDIIKLSVNKFEDIIPKTELKLKSENMLSIATSLGKIIELNHSVKTILLALKVMEEHKHFVTTKPQQKSFVYKMFEDTSLIAFNKNEWLKRLNLPSPSKEFYKSLYEDNESFLMDFNNYLNFQTDKKQKPGDSKVKVNAFSEQMQKVWSGSTVNYYKIYKRCYSVSFVINFIISN